MQGVHLGEPHALLDKVVDLEAGHQRGCMQTIPHHSLHTLSVLLLLPYWNLPPNVLAYLQQFVSPIIHS
jgi:hypothetical protein